MRLPRDLSGARLVRLLQRYGYQVVRQEGSHIRISAGISGVRAVTVPNHRAIKVGVLGDIVSEVAEQLGRDRDAFSEELFG